jgi:hypothetical protein
MEMLGCEIRCDLIHRTSARPEQLGCRLRRARVGHKNRGTKKALIGPTRTVLGRPAPGPLTEVHWPSARVAGDAISTPAFDPGCVKTLRGITAPGILRLVVTLRAKKTQKFILRSALRPNQISFSHGLDPLQSSPVQFSCAAKLLIRSPRRRAAKSIAAPLGRAPWRF